MGSSSLSGISTSALKVIEPERVPLMTMLIPSTWPTKSTSVVSSTASENWSKLTISSSLAGWAADTAPWNCPPVGTLAIRSPG
jgi:hypothetical protein